MIGDISRLSATHIPHRHCCYIFYSKQLVTSLVLYLNLLKFKMVPSLLSEFDALVVGQFVQICSMY